MSEQFPGASSYIDVRGKLRWRYRSGKRTVQLPGDPAASPEFESAYESAVSGQPIKKKAEIRRHPSMALPHSMKAAWKIVTTQTPEWKALDDTTAEKYRRIMERFLMSRFLTEESLIWADVDLRELERRHIKKILADRSDTPHAARHLLRLIRKMIDVALDHEWIDRDPSHRIKWRPAYVGFRAWTKQEMAQFEARWPVGTTQRLAYALALWLGNRRSDIVTLRWTDVRNDVATIVQKKTDRRLALDIVPMLKEALEATPKVHEVILTTAYGLPFSAKSLTGRMADWTRSAGLDPGCTLHGLRKTLGIMLAEGGATTRQIMDVLGHTDIAHAELYTRGADQAVLARDGMAKVVKLNRG